MRKKKGLLRSKRAFAEKKAYIMKLLSIKNRLKDNSDILAALADGYNPITGEEFGECVLDQPEILLALTLGSAALKNIASGITFDFSDTSTTKPPINANKVWTQEDDSILLEAYNNG